MADTIPTEEIIPIEEPQAPVSSPTPDSSIPAHIHDGVDSPRIHVGYVINNSRARAYLTSNATISGSAAAKIAFDTETYDTNAEFDSTTNRRFVAKRSGYYLVTTRVGFTAFASANIYEAQIRVNNTIVSANRYQATSTTAHAFGISVSDVRYLAATDYVEVFVDTDAGANNYTVIGGATYTFVTIHRIS